MQFSVLSSGSKANCSYVVNKYGSSFLVDAGLSAKQIEQRLLSLGSTLNGISGIVVTHEHSDHIRGIGAVSRRYKVPVYCCKEVKRFIDKPYKFETFEPGQTFTINEFTIHPFSIVHDAVEPVGFCIECDGLTLTHVTDLGRATPIVKEYVRRANAVVLEANHDPTMLSTCHYPWQLKQRIASSHGHLSNEDAAQLLAEAWHPELRHVVLAHLSENSNTPELAVAPFMQLFGDKCFDTFLVGNQHQATGMVSIQGTGTEAVALVVN
jgi:phosphoribosyl 1,2-cyclic phosphodiesterase